MGRLILALTLAGAAGTASAAYTYKYDDGTGNVNVGPNFAAQVLFGNVYTADPANNYITSIAVAWGSIPVGTSVSLALYDDPTDDGDPRDAVLLREVAGLADLPRTNTFIEYAIPGTFVTGDFFVAVKVRVDGTTIRPGRLDPQSAANASKSWLFAADTINDANLGGSPYMLRMSQNAVQGTFMVRANAIPAPGAAGMLALAGVVAARRRR